ncbi:nuclear transport factor 2 family protein [Micromonospora sp. NPDC000663]|uniref:nuclear transport factor 2 family protein n=1 Tax=Micromonospora sp. NPDC000663 TaxID=3364218 RepID=UPI0036B03D61
MDSAEIATSERLLTNLYAAFNERDIPALLAAMTPDVSWPNGWEGGLVHGRDEVSAYWRRQWDQIEPTVTPTAIAAEADGRIVVTVHQVVRDKTGATIADHTVTHVYRFDDGLVAEMEIRAQ